MASSAVGGREHRGDPLPLRVERGAEVAGVVGREHVVRDAPARDLAGRERPKLRFGCDGRWFAISVRDHYGSVDGPTLVRHVAKSLIRSGQVRTEGPGAGIGWPPRRHWA